MKLGISRQYLYDLVGQFGLEAGFRKRERAGREARRRCQLLQDGINV